MRKVIFNITTSFITSCESVCSLSWVPFRMGRIINSSRKGKREHDTESDKEHFVFVWVCVCACTNHLWIECVSNIEFYFSTQTEKQETVLDIYWQWARDKDELPPWKKNHIRHKTLNVKIFRVLKNMPRKMNHRAKHSKQQTSKLWPTWKLTLWILETFTCFPRTITSIAFSFLSDCNLFTSSHCRIEPFAWFNLCTRVTQTKIYVCINVADKCDVWLCAFVCFMSIGATRPRKEFDFHPISVKSHSCAQIHARALTFSQHFHFHQHDYRISFFRAILLEDSFLGK